MLQVHRRVATYETLTTDAVHDPAQKVPATSLLYPGPVPFWPPFVGAPNDGPGVLILSEFAGSAQSLSGAIRVNPWNTEELANAMHQALTLSRVERELRQHKLYR